MMGLVASNIEPDDADGGIRLYKEVIEFTDHPRAHLNIGFLYAQNNDKEQACQHWDYIVNNEGKLKKYVSYKKDRESAMDNLRIAKKPPSKKSGCFIATAVYGDVMAPEVICLRYYRDTVLIGTKTGRAFVEIYYKISPVLAAFISKSIFLRMIIRKSVLGPLVSILTSRYKSLR